MNRVKALDETLNAIKDSEGLSTEEIMTVILTEIAGSLAVIADVLADKDGKNNATLNNQVNLCDSCTYTYPECPSEKDDVIFGNGIGNDNICACNKYQPKMR